MSNDYKADIARRDVKIQKILSFLASGERWTTLEILVEMLGITETAVRRTVKKLVFEEALKIQKLAVGGRSMSLIGITPHGIALVSGVGCQMFQVNAMQVAHHIAIQKARLVAERNGGTEWKPDKILRADKSLKKVPDATFKARGGQVLALEAEKTIKSKKRYTEDMGNHLLEIVAGKWVQVHYVLSNEKLVPTLKKIFDEIKVVTINGEKTTVEKKHRDRFKIYSLDEWEKIQKQ